ncbi:MAG: type I restriction endonuclease subunit M, partial [Caldilineae bacterium]
YGTGIPACIIVLDKENARVRRGILMIDASKGFRKDGNKNRLRERDIHKIVDTFNEAREIPGYSRMVPLSEIEANDYNLNIPRYIDSGEAEDRQDLGGHLYGGIPARDVDALAAYWQVLPNLRQALFTPLRPGYLAVQVAPRQVRPTILAHPDFAAFRAQARAPFDAWRQTHRPRLLALSGNDHPKLLIRELADDLLARYAGIPLLDPYDLYQRLMDYWNETMQDDVYLILAEGWQEAARPRPLTAGGQNGKESPDLTVGKKKYKMDLLPPDLLARRFFPDRLARLADLQAAAETAASELDAFVEEHSGDEGLLADALTGAGKLTKKSLNARLKEIWGRPDFAEEEAALRRALVLMEAKSQADKALKTAQKALDEAIFWKYDALSEADIQTLTVDDKWLAALEAAVTEEVERIAQRLAARVTELAERYADPLPQIEQEVADLRASVEEHLQKIMDRAIVDRAIVDRAIVDRAIVDSEAEEGAK